jgi:hypothetical protein
MKMNTNMLLKCVTATIVTGAALVLLQLWFDLFNDLVFWKLIVTLGVLGLVASFVIAIRVDMDEEKKMKDDKFVN